MEPDANIKEQLELANALLNRMDAEKPVDEDDVSRLCGLVIALDWWIHQGGFLPKRWGGG